MYLFFLVLLQNDGANDIYIRAGEVNSNQTGVTFGTGPTIVGTQSGNSPSNTSIVTYDFTSSLDSGDNIIDAGDVVHISIESNSSPGGSTKYYFTCLFEWDYSSI